MFVLYRSMPPLIRSKCRSMKPGISMAPQKVISPSPWAKCRSPMENSPPDTKTGMKTRLPTPRSLMSTLPPCSRGGMVRQASAAARSKSAPLSLPSSASFGSGGSASAGTCGALGVAPPCAGTSPVTRSGLRSINACSRRFHSASRSAEGAQPKRPGWELPMNRTPGTCRELVQMPSRSQIALDAPGDWSVRKPPPFSLAQTPGHPPAVLLGEDPGVSPRLFVEGTHVDDVDDQKVAWLGALDGERPAQDVTGVQVHVPDVFGVVAVADLVVGPVLALDPVRGAWADRVGRRDVGVPAVVTGHGLLGHRHCQVAIDLKDDLGHESSSSSRDGWTVQGMALGIPPLRIDGRMREG